MITESRKPMENDRFQVLPAEPDTIARAWEERWGGDLIVSPRGDYRPGDVEGLEAVDTNGNLLALATWHIDDDGVAEIVSLDALAPGQGYGRRLLRRAVGHLRALDVQRIVLFTTNDNVGAIRMYLLEGWRVLHIHTDAMDMVREKKLDVPRVGMHDLPLRDMWELEYGEQPASG